MLREFIFIFTIQLFAGNCLIIKQEDIINEHINNEHITIEHITHEHITNENTIYLPNYFDESLGYDNNSFVDEENLGTYRGPINTGVVPDYFDWRDKKCVSPVKDQEKCGACWAFSAVDPVLLPVNVPSGAGDDYVVSLFAANIESHLKIYLNQEEVLSEQFLIDCDDINNGCSSSSILKSFAHIVSNFNGVLRNQDYHPYANGRMRCRWNRNPQPIPVVGFKRISQDEKLMAEAIYKYGPLSAAINSASMDVYKGNYIDEPKEEDCSPSKLDHAILIVGYNTYADKRTGRTVPYWIIKNSWGTRWGDSGYYYLVRGRNACGIASDVSFAFVN